MSTVNRVFLVGNLGKDPEVKQLGTGTTVCNFSVATEYQAQGGASKTSWHNITAWSKTAEACSKHLRKGSKVCVEGRIDYREYEAKDGTGKRYATDIVADKVTFLSSVAREESAAPTRTVAVPAMKPATQQPAWYEKDDGDIPF
jgi:single-strand DNA-binding protein